MLSQIGRIIRRNYSPLNIIEVSSDNIRHNYQYLSSIDKSIKIAPVLKSNAYGHDIKLFGKEVDKLSPPFICVDSLYEAYELQRIKIKTPILIMGYVAPLSLRTKLLPFSFAVYTKEMVDALASYQPQAKVHIFVDTGMHREGIDVSELANFVKYVKEQKLFIEGLMSHFAMADKPNHILTKSQVDKFQESQKIMSTLKVIPIWIHIANSSGILNAERYKGKLGNLARTGLALYGIDPMGKNRNVKPTLILKTHIEQIKTIKAGESIGYDFTFVAKRNMRIAILPIGYHDGVDRRLSNKGYVSYKAKILPIVGRISMNISTVDVTNANVAVGAMITIYSNDYLSENSIQNSARMCDTIPYELLIHLASSTKRVVI